MPGVARNAPCPCGSGRKHKLCCGETRAQERAREEALADVADLAGCFPFVRPWSSAFEDWAGERCLCVATAELVKEGVDAIPLDERMRILGRGRAADLVLWQHARLCAGGEEQVERALLAGGVSAALGERCEPPGLRLFLVRGALPGEGAGAVLGRVL